MPLIKFAEWAPDQATLNSSFASNVLNVLPAANSYIPFRSFVTITSALPDKPLGAIMARSLSGQVSIFAGTATHLYKLNNTTLDWDDVSQTLTTYSASDTAKWSFEQFGEYVVAVNLNDDPQRFLLGTDTEFSTLAGSPPRANTVRSWGDFLVLLQTATNPNRVHWSGLNNIEHWTPGDQNSDFQDFPDGGVVQGSNSATNPLIFLERAIYAGQFVPGSAAIFAFQKIHDKRGAKSVKSIGTRGSYAFYTDEGGFFQIAPDGSIASVGREKVDRSTFEELTAADIANIRGEVDPFHSRVYWAVDDDSDGYFDRILSYDWELKRWSPTEVDISLMFPAALLGYTLEGLDAFGSLDSLAASLDAKVWQGGAPVLAAFNRDNELGFFNGEAMEALLETQEAGDPAAGVQRITEVVPIVDANDLADVGVSLGARMRRSDGFVWTPYVSPSTNTGIARKRSRARFHKVRMRIAAGASWEHAEGVSVNPSGAGSR